MYCIKILSEKGKLIGFDRLNETEKYCRIILNNIWDEKKIEKYIVISCSAIELTIDNTKNISYGLKPRSVDFTKELHQQIMKKKNAL